MRITAGRAAASLISLAVIAAAIWFLLPAPVPVEVSTVAKGRFVATVDEDGKTRVRERYVVTAPLAGRQARVQLKVGDAVGEGTVITTIQPSPAPFLDPRTRIEATEKLGAAEANLDRAQAAVGRSNAQNRQADRDLARARTLFERNVGSAQALEKAELTKRVAERDQRAAEYFLHAAEHELAQARALLTRYDEGLEGATEVWKVTAPVKGEVLKVAQKSETIVQSGSPIIEIGDPHDLEIATDVLSTDAVEIKPGADVVIEHWGGPGPLAGRVRRVEPAGFTKVSTLGVEEQRVNIIIDIVSPAEQWTGLGDAYQVDTRITVLAMDDATIVPAGALFRRGEDWSVFVVKDGRAELRTVSLVRRSARTAAVSAGLKPGEQVVVYPSDRVESGVRLAILP
jgi:HlyD family secretion protein